MRRSFGVFAAAAASVAAPTSASNPKMAALHKLLTGEIHFRNDAPLKACNIEHNFGANWKSEAEAYAKTLPADQKTIFERQITRVSLTRYTTRELSIYCGEGPEHVDAVARQRNIADGKAYLQNHGNEKFEAYVKAEAKNANWSEEDGKKFIDAVKAAK